MQQPRHLLVHSPAEEALASLQPSLLALRSDWICHLARSEAEALAACDEFPVDLVLADLAAPMPPLPPLLHQLRERAPDVPIVALVHRESHVDFVSIESSPVHDVLTWPLDLDQARLRLRNALRFRDHQRELEHRVEQRLRERMLALECSRVEIILRLAKANEMRDHETGNHVLRVAHFSRTIAEQLGLPGEAQERLFLTSPLHDIGKIGVPDAVLLKPAMLSPAEREIMESHCRIGYDILQTDFEVPWDALSADLAGDAGATSGRNPLLQSAAQIALAHHERWDGGGYPNGLRGEQIPLPARIVAVADVFDALCNERPYKPALPPETALAAMRIDRGAHFDPQVFDAFRASFPTLVEINRLLRDREPGRALYAAASISA